MWRYLDVSFTIIIGRGCRARKSSYRFQSSLAARRIARRGKRRRATVEANTSLVRRIALARILLLLVKEQYAYEHDALRSI